MSLDLRLYQLPGSNPALAFSDPAGTNACIAIYKLYEMMPGKRMPLLFSNSSYYPPKYHAQVSDTVPDFKEQQIDCLFTGTSHPGSSGGFEVACIREAKRNEVYTISFIDHWINFRLRFDGLKDTELPDEIWVVDDAAKRLAANEGLPPGKLVIRSNPYHAYLRSYWKSRYENKEYLKIFGIDNGCTVILFAPDPFSIRDRYIETGFTEKDALISLIRVINKFDADILLLIKAHPLQPLNLLEEALSGFSPSQYKLIQDADNCELINASDIVIGFHSNFLLEARALNKKVIRFFPGNGEADLLRYDKELGESCKNADELAKQIAQYIHG